MARVVRKVSNRNVSRQKKQRNILKNKWFWIISVISVIIIAGVTTLLIINSNKTEKDYSNTVDYFTENQDVDFNVTTYHSVKNYADVNYKNPQNNEQLHVSNIFIFAYDMSTFYPVEGSNKDADGNDLYAKQHKAVLSLLVDLQKAVDKAQADGLDVELYIIDISFSSNYAVLLDTEMGGSDEPASTFMFTYIQNGEKAEELKIGGSEYELFSTNLNNMITTVIPKTIYYVQDGLVEEE